MSTKIKKRTRTERVKEEPPKPAIKSIEYRKKRGEKLNYLINLNKQEDEDDNFWNNNKYFNDENIKSDDESFHTKGDEKLDSYDSDFGNSTESEEQQASGSVKEENKKVIVKARVTDQSKKSYIHDYFGQDYLIKEAILTETLNKISLSQLIQIEEDKKKIKQERLNQIEGPFIRTISNLEGNQIMFIDFDKEMDLFPKQKKIMTNKQKKNSENKSNIKEIQDKIQQLEKKLNSLTH